MKLATLKLIKSDQGNYLGGQTLYEVPKGTFLMVKRNDDDQEAWDVYEAHPLKTSKQDPDLFS